MQLKINKNKVEMDNSGSRGELLQKTNVFSPDLNDGLSMSWFAPQVKKS